MEVTMKKKICQYLSKVLVEMSEEELMKTMEIPPEEKMGDLALPCFAMAKKMRKNPMLIAAELVEKLNEQKDELGIEKVESVGAYCNIHLKRDLFVEKCFESLQKDKYGVSQIGAGKTVCMDYSSPNIAKNFHVGHLRTTVIGNSLYKIYQKLGYDVVRINHLGDWGTQFGKLIVAYKLWSSEELVKEKGIEELLRIYVKFENESKKNESLIVEAREWFVKMEQNDPEALEIWNWFKDISMVEFERIYDLLGISFDSYLGESFYRDKVPALVEKLKEMKLLVESQGAQVIDLEKYDMPPCLITKSDGGSIYHSRDIAAILYRKETYDFEKCLYVTGLEQSLHFKQIFTAIEVMGYDWSDGLIHVPYGLVSLAGEKLSTRGGNIIYAEDILKEAIERAYNAIIEKNPSLNDKEETAKKVGVGAIIFHDLFNQRIKNVDFSWKEVLNFDGTTGPYAQYTYARAKSVLRKAGKTVEAGEVDYSALTDDVTYNLVKVLAGYEDAVLNAAEKNEPSVVARYVISLATAFNKFYHDCTILQAEEKEKKARLMLTDMVQKILCEACGLLGMECPEEM
jgi:arginyl-tRNA synthetase